MIRVSVRHAVDFDALARQWRALEARSDASFFLSWTWIGCLAAERFPDPVLVEAAEDGCIVALALFNRARRRGVPVLHLHESGDAALDCPYIEHNGVLTEAGREAELTRLCLGAVARRYPVVLSGIGDGCREAIQAVAAYTRVRRAQPAHFVDLAVLRPSGQPYLASRSANTRQQVRRSERYFGKLAGGGEIAVARAASVQEGQEMLDALAVFHQDTWRARGKPGAFARPFFRRFHRALIERGLPAGDVMLLKIAIGDQVIGYLYNFRFRNQVIAYQSGFHYVDAAPDARPGLLAHVAAIQESLSENIQSYDFLAGDDRYKRSLSNASRRLSWVEAGPLWFGALSGGWVVDGLKRSFRTFRRGRSPSSLL